MCTNEVYLLTYLLTSSQLDTSDEFSDGPTTKLKQLAIDVTVLSHYGENHKINYRQVLSWILNNFVVQYYLTHDQLIHSCTDQSHPLPILFVPLFASVLQLYLTVVLFSYLNFTWSSVSVTLCACFVIQYVCFALSNMQREPKKHTKMFLSYLPQNLSDSDKLW